MFHDDGGTRGGGGIGACGRNELRSADRGGSRANSGNSERGGAVIDEEDGDIAGSGERKRNRNSCAPIGARQRRMQNRSSYSSSSVL